MPIEPFYEALFPHLKDYGITAQFPADKHSAGNEIAIEFDVWIGEPPRAVFYSLLRQHPHEMGLETKSIQADELSHLENGEKLSFRIHTENGIPGKYYDGKLSGWWFEIEFTGEKEQIGIMRKAIEPILAELIFNSVELEVKSLAEESQTNVGLPKFSQKPLVDFDEQLSESASQIDASQGLTTNLYKPQYEPLDLQAITKPANRVEVRAALLPNIALAVLIFFFGGGTLLFLFGSSFKLTNLVAAAVCLTIIFVNCFLVFRAVKKSVREFDANGIKRGDGKHFSWDEFRGVVIRTGNTRYGMRGVWREELAFANGETAWIIPNRIKNYNEVFTAVNQLPRAVLKDASGTKEIQMPPS